MIALSIKTLANIKTPPIMKSRDFPTFSICYKSKNINYFRKEFKVTDNFIGGRIDVVVIIEIKNQ